MSQQGAAGGRPDPAEFSSDALLDRLTAGPAGGAYLLAYSGGLDSGVLLAALAELQQAGRLPGPLRAAYIDHRLHADSAAWGAHCQACCDALGVALSRLRVDAGPARGESPEAAARAARYRALAGELRPGEILLTAQHRDDQVETLLYRLLRGSGSRGLSGMRAWRRFGDTWLGRPLLPWSREALRDWAVSRDLRWIEDPSNADSRYDRNFLRNQVVPLLQQRFPGFEAPLLRAADNLADDADALDELAATDLAGFAEPAALRIPGLLALSRPRQLNLLRVWLSARIGQSPPRNRLQQVLDELLAARGDAQPALDFPGGSLRRYRDRLCWVDAQPALADDWRQPWNGRDVLHLAGSGAPIDAARLRASGVRWPDSASLEFRAVPPGLRVRMAGGSRGSRPLKKLLQEAGVPPWQRRRLAVLFADGQAVWVEQLGALQNF